MKNPLNALTATRAIAALVVVVHHYGYKVFPFNQAGGFFRNGHLAVSYFFVLSGFIMYAVYGNREIDASIFLKRRLARIYPVYLLASLFMVLSLLVLHATGNGGGALMNKDAVIGELLGVFFLQTFIPRYALTLNFPAWSLSVEMFFYLMFPMLAVLLRRNLNWFLGLAITLFTGAMLTQLLLITPAAANSWIENALSFHPFIHLNQFLIGMLGGYCYRNGRIWRDDGWGRALPVVFFALIILVTIYKPEGLLMHTGLMAPLFVLLIMSIAQGGPYLLRGRWLVFLGEISYGVYILQVPVHSAAMFVNSRWLGIGDAPFFYCYVVALIGIAWLCYYLVERPVRRWLVGEK
jgi:peptidoglycan/LPS O-acetylase OafA/YrhL